jgi:hypothetical protein
MSRSSCSFEGWSTSIGEASDEVATRCARGQASVSASSRSTWRGFSSIGDPWDTRMRFNDSISA